MTRSEEDPPWIHIYFRLHKAGAVPDSSIQPVFYNQGQSESGRRKLDLEGRKAERRRDEESKDPGIGRRAQRWK